ncbi:MAG: hypothetical protein RL434_2644 [Pseudomonadota bacterium]|jgi:protein SCO1/2
MKIFLKRVLPMLAIAVLAFGLGRYYSASTEPGLAPVDAPGFLWPNPPKLEPFALTDEEGQPFDEKSLADKWTLLFFGYTHCPDICPVTLALLKEARKGLRDLQAFDEHAQVFLISVDGARDTPEVLRTYVRHFDPSFRAATGAPEALHLLTRQVAADFTRVTTDDSGDYWFDHSPAILLVAPDQRVVGEFLPPHTPEDLIREIRQIVAFVEEQG